MINIIWGLLIVIGIIYSVVSGNSSGINLEILESGKSGLKMILEILPVLVVWNGLTKIAEESGMLERFATFLHPLLSKLFPSIKDNKKALGYIASNVAVNMAGLGSAATPFGLKAMDELQKINDKKDTASEAMITFLVLNTGGVTIIPTTVLALRVMYKSIDPTSIIIPSIIATMCACISGLLLDYYIRRRNNR